MKAYLSVVLPAVAISVSFSGNLLAEPSSVQTLEARNLTPNAGAQVKGRDGGSTSEGRVFTPIPPMKVFTPSETAVRFFSEALRPHGQWVEIEGYGQCWKPKVDANWRPYLLGHWAYSDCGWVWVSDEDFGAIVYHYGRWMQVKDEGWCWVPDLEWAPAWVSWRYGTEFLGWAPLPPSASWNAQSGIASWVDRDCQIGPDAYRFCLIPDFGSIRLKENLLSPDDNPRRVRRTVNTTNLVAYQGTVFTGGPSFEWIASRAREKVQVFRIQKERSLFKYRELVNGSKIKFQDVQKGDALVVMAPEWGILSDPKRADNLGFYTEEVNEKSGEWIEGASSTPAIPKESKIGPLRFVAKPTIYTGWERMTDVAARKALETKISREAAGLNARNYPARPVDPAVDFAGINTTN